MSSEEQKTPSIRFKGYKDDWEQRKLIEVANYRNGKAHEQNVSDNGKYIVINSKFVSTNGVVRKYSDKQIEPMKLNEIAFVLSDVPNGRAIARTFLVGENSKYTLNQRVAGITPHSNTDAYFLHQLMNRHHYFLRFDDGVKQTNLSKENIEKFSERYPSHEEQNQIGFFLKKIDDTIALHQQQLDKYKELKKSMMQKLFTQELRFKDQEGNDYPKWERKKANEIFKPYSEKNAAHLPILSATQDRGLVYRDEVGIDIKYNKDSLYSYKIVRVNDFVISLRSFQGGFELSDKEGIVSPAYTIFSKSNQEIHEIYFKHFFKTEHFINRLNTLVYGIRDGKSISFKEFGELKMNVPCYKEQQKIGDFLSLLDSNIDKMTGKIHWLNEQKKWFRQKMFV